MAAVWHSIKGMGRIAGLLFATSLLTFFLLRSAPGDPLLLIAGAANDQATGDPAAAQAAIERQRQTLGLDQPWMVQYGRWLQRVLQADFGTSLRSRQPVRSELFQRLPATVLLAITAFSLQSLLALVGGIAAAHWRGRWPDAITHFIAIVAAAMPGFLLAWGLLAVFTIHVPWYDLGGPANIGRVWLPALTLAVLYAPAVMRVIRARLLVEMDQFYTTFGRARGFGKTRLILRHALRNALLPVITLLGMNLTAYLSGAAVIESVMSWPGIGKYAIDSILARDYPVVQGYVLLVTALVIGINQGVALLATLLDPRLRYRQEQP